jgi:Na+:H+ antiporter, NhaC family
VYRRPYQEHTRALALIEFTVHHLSTPFELKPSTPLLLSNQMIDLILLSLAYVLGRAFWKIERPIGAVLIPLALLFGRFIGGASVGAQLSDWSMWSLWGVGASLSATVQIVSISAAVFGLSLAAYVSSWSRAVSMVNTPSTLGHFHALATAALPLSFLMLLLCWNVHFYGNNTLGGANQVALLLSALLAGVLGRRLGVAVSDQVEGVKRAIGDTVEAILILLLIGSLAGTWMLSGVVPAMIDYGLSLMAPSYFLVASCLLCAFVSLASGSSWSTVATVGVALMGVGQALGFEPALCAGAIISGAYFGDKLSPLSDTTNLAPAMAGGSLIPHIKAMLWTTVPSMTLCVLIFILFGLNAKSGVDLERIESIQAGLRSVVWIHPVLFLVPISVIVLIIRRVPTLPTLAFGALIGGVMALWAQPELIAQVGGATGFKGGFIAVMNALTTKTSISSPDPTVSALLTAKGMEGMMGTIWLVLCALTFGGVMEKCGFLRLISQEILKKVRSDRGLVGATVGSCLFLNVTASDQYLAIVVPGRMYREVYTARGLAPEALSRTLEDAGTVTSVLIPWNTCGAMQASVLGVATFAYAPYCFFNWISPLMTLLFAYLSFRQPKMNHP